MKYLLLLVVLAVVVAVFFGRRRPPPSAPSNTPGKPAARQAPGPQPMVACAHCGVHLPEAEALRDAAGRPYCGDAHRLLGPR